MTFAEGWLTDGANVGTGVTFNGDSLAGSTTTGTGVGFDGTSFVAGVSVGVGVVLDGASILAGVGVGIGVALDGDSPDADTRVGVSVADGGCEDVRDVPTSSITTNQSVWPELLSIQDALVSPATAILPLEPSATAIAVSDPRDPSCVMHIRWRRIHMAYTTFVGDTFYDK